MTRRQDVRRKLSEPGRVVTRPVSRRGDGAGPGDQAGLLSMLDKVASAVLDVTRKDYPVSAGTCVPVCLVTEMVLQYYGVDAQAVPVRRSIAGGRDVEHAVVLIRSPATDVIVDLQLDRPERWFVTGDEPGLRVPNQPITVGTAPSLTYTLRPDQGWNDALLAAVRPTMPPGYPDEVVLAMYQAALAEYVVKAVGIVNRVA